MCKCASSIETGQWQLRLLGRSGQRLRQTILLFLPSNQILLFWLQIKFSFSASNQILLFSASNKKEEWALQTKKSTLLFRWHEIDWNNRWKLFETKRSLKIHKRKEQDGQIQGKTPKISPSTQKSLQMCKMCKTHRMYIADQPNRVCNKKSPPNACTSRDVEWNCSTNVLWAFHLHVFRVGLFGVFGPDKKCILMYYHLVTQCCSVFSEKLVRQFDVSWLRIYGLFQPASMFLRPAQIFMTFL